MSKYINKSIYFPSDKNIFDALQSKGLTRTILDDFLKRKGILLSQFDEKKDIAFYISRMIFDYHDYIFLTSVLETPGQREKLTNCSLPKEIKIEDITSACKNFKSSDHSYDDIRFTQQKNKVIIEVKDTEVDFSKTELKQKTKKSYKIEFDISEVELNARYTANEKSQEILTQIVKGISDIKGKVIEPEKISLQSITSSQYRNEFFIKLINSLPQHRLYNVTKIEIQHNINTNDIPLDESEDETLLDIEPSDISSGFINKVSLMGMGVLESPEFVQLNQKNFYISKINWMSIDQSNSEGDKIEFEAQFGDPDSCTNFQYIVKGVYSFHGEEYSSNRKKLSNQETSKKLKLIEETAKKAYEEIVSNLEEESSGDEEI